MFTRFTPYTHIFLALYYIVIRQITFTNSFFMYWIIIEVLILLFIGFSYTLFFNGYTQLILYFLFQTLGSFRIIVAYLFRIKYFILFSIFLKLGIFPFYSWYINVLYRFPNPRILLASTWHKLPPVFIFYIVLDRSVIRFVFIFLTLTVLVSAVFMMSIYDMRYLIIVSSIGNNSFLLLALITQRIYIFILFYVAYYIAMSMIMKTFRQSARHNYSHTPYSIFEKLSIFFIILNMASLPPLPIFLGKFMVLLNCVSIYRSHSIYLLIIVLINVMMMVRYVNVTFKYLINVYTNRSQYFLY